MSQADKVLLLLTGTDGHTVTAVHTQWAHKHHGQRVRSSNYGWTCTCGGKSKALPQSATNVMTHGDRITHVTAVGTVHAVLRHQAQPLHLVELGRSTDEWLRQTWESKQQRTEWEETHEPGW